MPYEREARNTLWRVEAKSDISDLALRVGYSDRLNDTSEVIYSHLHLPSSQLIPDNNLQHTHHIVST